MRTSVLAMGALLAWAGPAAAEIPNAQFFATRVVSYAPGAGYEAFPDPLQALGGPHGLGYAQGNDNDVVTLGQQGSLVLGFDERMLLRDGPGPDLIVFENAFGAPYRFGELVRVGVSSNGVDFAFFPVFCAETIAIGPYETIDPTLYAGFAGVGAVFANVGANSISPFDPAVAGGDAFDLASLRADPLVTNGRVLLDRIAFVKLLDVLGDGTELDSLGRAIYDPTGTQKPPYSRVCSADIDAIAVVNGWRMPTTGDANGDGAVDILDLTILANHYGQGGGLTWGQGDFNGDGVADLSDLTLMASYYGWQEAASAPLPEPTALVLLAAGAAALRRRRP